jgi:hypothetical protein
MRTIGEDLKPLDDRIAAGFRQRQIPAQASEGFSGARKRLAVTTSEESNRNLAQIAV